jgi:peptide/nickel transport system substrate-binding protein
MRAKDMPFPRAFGRARLSRPFRGALGAGALVLAASLIAACSSSGTTGSTTSSRSSAASTSGTLTVQFAGPPILGLDPSHEAGGQSVIYTSLAYDSLIYQESSGSLAPDLATSWKWLGSGHTQFELTLRSGVKFSDGSTMTPAGVAQWLLYFKNANSIRSTLLAQMVSAKATGPDTVVMTLSSPNPDLPYILTQTYGAGYVASPKAMDKPGSLANATDGTGPFELDPSATVTGDHYTYVRNPDYWNPSAVHYTKVIVKAVATPTSVESAVQSGEINVALGDPTTMSAAKSAGLTVVSAQSGVTALFLLDRAGRLVKALGSQSVREAINYAIDRPGIIKALYPSGGAVPTSQMGVPEAGFDPSLDNYYSYDPAKAKSLLASAGYPNGFSFTAMCSPILGTCTPAQAVAASLSSVGIIMNIDQESQISNFNQKFSSAQVPAVFFTSGDRPYIEAQSLVSPTSFENSFKSTDPAVTSAYGQVAAAPTPAAETTAYQGLIKDITQLAWFAPIYRTQQFIYVNAVSGVSLSSADPNYYSPVDPTGQYSWRPAS